jgi:transcriptional regulator with XRE-family HTH domain
MNQRELARLARIPENTLSRYVNGERTPKVDAVVNMARVLECSVAELVQFGDIITK